MSAKITISIPTKTGAQNFNLSRTKLWLLILGLLSILAGGSVYIVQTKQSEQQRYDALIKKLTTSERDNATLEALYAEQIDTTHSLSQILQEKENQLQMLGKRVYDVEAVLGLANEEAPTELALEDRVDAAAIDSAVRATMFRMIPNDTPLNYQRISSSYGRRTNPISGKRHSHSGIDLTCKMGTPIHAPADGVIETVRPSKKGYGNFLTMRHSFGFMSSYAHLAKFNVRSGQFVRKGDVIAKCGNSGNSTGPHLHYEVRFLGRTLNPQYTMDWTPDNFNYLFEKEKKVKWAPLIALIDDTVRLQVNLTNVPYIDKSLDTVQNQQNDLQEKKDETETQ